MVYSNPVLKGFYPDPSVCFAEGRYFMVCSSFQYFPGVPLFESCDLVNWKQIGHCLTRKSQVELDKINSSGGVFAPTIRYNNGRFYMVTTNDTTHRNFYVWTDDIYGEWSEPVLVDQDGIDPSLYFEDGRCFFLSNGTDDNGNHGVVQCEINIETGEKLSESRVIWQGSGGRYLESPHMYKINGLYYLMTAEGGTEYGHMVTYARSSSIWGKFEGYHNNPVLTNRNLGGYTIQGVGHGDLIQNKNGDWFMLHLGFRQIDRWLTFHHLGREVFLTPVFFGEDGWFTAGSNGTCTDTFEIKGDFTQAPLGNNSFANTAPFMEWCFLRHPVTENYSFSENKFTLTATDVTLDMADTPTFIGIRQRDFNAEISCELKSDATEAGITLYMDENHHYDLAVELSEEGNYVALLRLNIGEAKCVQNKIHLTDNSAKLKIYSNSYCYSFILCTENGEIQLGTAQTRYLSSEVAGGFTGVLIGLYATGEGSADFISFNCDYNKNCL
ncbi:MAG: glycoside hydrolase family 43 protein [Ruminococcus sp.]|nr:glycoside hydrolase family 43 protein [Ruminococcus sp.]